MLHQELWNSLKAMDPGEVCRRSLASYDQQTRGYRLRILDRDYLVLPESGVIRGVDSSAPHSFGFCLLVAILNYLICAEEIPLSGNWISEKQFPSGPLFFRGPHAMPTKEIEQKFGQDSDGFTSACLACRGTKVEGGDLTFELPVFPRIPVRLILWLADEEFPARVSYLFDRTANIHLKLDALYAVGKIIESELLEEAAKPK
jgi:hypothetical protein